MRFQFERWTPRNILMPAILIFLASLLVFSGCTSHRPAPQTPEAAGPMILVDGPSLPTISFGKIFTDVPGGRVIGYYYEGLEYTRGFKYKWDETFENETRELNFQAQDLLADAGYRVNDGSLGDLRLEGTIRKLSYNTYTYKVSFDQAECEVRWELFRAGETDPYFTSMTNGAGRIADSKPGALRAAFELAMRRLLADEEFVEKVKSRK